MSKSLRSDASDGVHVSIRTALFRQLLAGILGFVPVFLLYDIRMAAGVGFGVLISMLSTALLGRRIERAVAADPEQGQRMLYAGAVMRFVLVLVALVLAYGLGLHLLSVAAGMFLAQMAMFFFAAGGMKDQYRQG